MKSIKDIKVDGEIFGSYAQIYWCYGSERGYLSIIAITPIYPFNLRKSVCA